MNGGPSATNTAIYKDFQFYHWSTGTLDPKTMLTFEEEVG